jgi:ataxia telangiectasia mutated family protein
MAHRKPAFAELLLPLAFADLARHAPLSPPPTAAEDDGDGDGDGDGDVPPDASQRLGAVIAAEVLPRGQDHPKTMRLLLRCLNHVRSLQVEAKMAPPKGGRAPAAAGAPLDPRDVARWRRVYWLDLDYLHVAAAAVRSRAYFTALLYVEAWCEGRGGGRLALPDAAAEPRRAEADALLLEVHSRIEEPDGLYAVARSNELLPQLRRSEREGDWATALVTCDIALSLLAEREAGGGQGGGTVGGLSAEAARASLARSLSRLGASALLAGAGRGGGQGAARAAAAGLGQWTPLDPGGGAADGGAGGADADLTAAVAALGAGAAERCGQALASARRGLVAGLATAGVESAGDVNPALVRLQMLQAVAEAWELRWPQLPDLGSVGSPANARAGRPPGAAPALPPALASVAERWRGREAWAGEGGRYALLAPLQDLRRQLLRTLDAPEQEAACLAQAALAARKTGHFGHAAASLCRLRALLDRGAGAAWAAALAAPGAGWRVEEAKLLWAQGQHDSALALARRLLRASPLPAAGPGAGDAAYLHTLAAKWMAATATEADSSILRMMQEATAQPVAAPHPAAARIMFRLGQYADGLYCSLRDRASTVEWATAQAVIASKQREIEALQANVAALRAAGRSAEHSSVKHIQYQITTRSKPLEEDIAEREAQPVREASLRAVALGAYGRCLTAGDEYDLPAVFRIVQMWLSMTDDRDVVDRVVPILRLAPSRKFLPLMYQVASRLSAAAAGPAAASGFQASVFELVVRLGREHPHHSLPQVFALRNGARVQGGAAGGLAHVADADKVLAAQRALDAVAAGSPAARELVRQMGVAIDGYIELAAVKVDKHATSMPFPAGFKRVLT